MRPLLLCFCVLAAGCRGEPAPPQLLDGRVANAPPVTLEGVAGTTIETTVDVVSSGKLTRSPAAASCLSTTGDAGDQVVVVVRVGVVGESVTLTTSGGRALVACDGTSPHGRSERWCGRSYGRVRGGPIADPRLDLACTDASGHPIAFAWMEPGHRAHYVVVRQHGYSEVYPVVAGLPVRVATSNVDLERASASFELSEHDVHGRVLRRYRLQTAVAG